jgi:hypothetical protein
VIDFRQLLEDVSRIPLVVERARTRNIRQREIEDLIMQFKPDCIEATEILAALTKSLERYEDKDIEECHRWYVQALEKRDMKAVRRGPDEMDLAKWDRLTKEEA